MTQLLVATNRLLYFNSLIVLQKRTTLLCGKFSLIKPITDKALAPECVVTGSRVRTVELHLLTRRYTVLSGVT